VEIRKGKKEVNAMKSMILSGLLALVLAPMAWGQEKVEAPVWNVGDKWVFTGDGTIEIGQADPNGYVMNFSDSVCVLERQGFNKIIFDKSTLQRSYSLEGKKQRKYKMGLKNIFNFPLRPGKQWKHAYSTKPILGEGYMTGQGLPTLDYYENIKILGWEEIGSKKGKFRTLKIEFIGGFPGYQVGMLPRPGFEFKNYYWYSPDVGYFVKCEYDKALIKRHKEIFNWQLISFQLKK
jgi:hypothetical protein